MKCPYCQDNLTIGKNDSYYYCNNYLNCKYAKGNERVVAMSIDKKDFFLPLKKDFITLGFAKSGIIRVRDTNYFLTQKETIIPYFPPDLDDLNNTIKRIEKLLTFS
jgi:hypothetical protein